jgi:hypothetical protein
MGAGNAEREVRPRGVVAGRNLGVGTPEDPYPVWQGPGGPAVVAPLFLLYDYSFRPTGATTKTEALAQAVSSGAVCTDEWLLYPDPYPSREAWCRARVDATARRLEALDPALPTILVNHFPLARDPTQVLYYPAFAQWCGTTRTAGWHLRFRHVRWSTDISTFLAPPGTTACRSGRSHSATPGSGGDGRALRTNRGRCSRDRAKGFRAAAVARDRDVAS